MPYYWKNEKYHSEYMFIHGCLPNVHVMLKLAHEAMADGAHFGQS